jgi:ribonuclease I
MDSKNTYWNDQREYFKEKTLAFKELKRKREIEIMKKELERSKIKQIEKKLEINN